MRERIVLLIILTILTVSLSSYAQEPAPWDAVQQAFGRTGQPQADGGMKFGMPRNDMNVRIGDVQLKPTLALGSWVAFDSPGKNAMVMGDLVLAENEVASVIEKLQAKGIEITGIHNHLLHETPRVTYVHIGGHGDAATIAATLKEVLALTNTPAPAPAKTPAAAAPQPAIDLPASQIEAILGQKGKGAAGVLQFSVPRPDDLTQAGHTLPKWMGLGTAINFQPLGNGRAAITGDFALDATEVNPVLRTLAQNGIAVTALHSHMLDEQPRRFFMHFWATDDALKLARGLRMALDKIHPAGNPSSR